MAMRVNGQDELGREFQWQDQVGPELAAAMRDQLAAFRASLGWSIYVLACDIAGQTDVDINEEALRRWLLGTQRLQQHKLRAIHAYLIDHNPETADRAKRTARAIAMAAGLCEGWDEAALPSITDYAGLFSARYLDSCRIDLEYIPVAHSAALLTERFHASDSIEIATGEAALDPHGTLKIEMRSPRGSRYYYEHFGTVRADENGPVNRLTLGRLGMPLDLCGDKVKDEAEVIEHILENLLTFHRVPDDEAGAAAAPLPRAHVRGEVRARDAAIAV